jgi:hypothetical protein
MRNCFIYERLSKAAFPRRNSKRLLRRLFSSSAQRVWQSSRGSHRKKPIIGEPALFWAEGEAEAAPDGASGGGFSPMILFRSFRSGIGSLI